MSATRTHGGRRGYLAPAAVVALVAAALGVVSLVVGLTRPQAVPPLHFSAPPTPHRPARSAPVRLTIDAIGVDTNLQRLDLDASRRTVQLPRDPARAGWYERGATPGDTGPTIIVGYLAARPGAGPTDRLGELRIGQSVRVQRADGTRVVYRIDTIASYPAGEPPATDAPSSTLRIIFCDDRPRPGQQRWIVADGHQLAVHPLPTSSRSPGEPVHRASRAGEPQTGGQPVRRTSRQEPRGRGPVRRPARPQPREATAATSGAQPVAGAPSGHRAVPSGRARDHDRARDPRRHAHLSRARHGHAAPPYRGVRSR